MSVRFITLICLLFGGSYVPFSGLAQQRCLTIADSLARKPVPYATVYWLKTRTGTYADERGNVCPDKLADSVTVSAVGYNTRTFLLRYRNSPDTLFLARETTLLREVVITDRKNKRKLIQLGHRNKSLFSENSYNPNGGFRLATFISSDGHAAATVRRVVCELSAHKKSVISAYKVRIRLYADNPISHLPDTDLLLKNVVVDVPNTATKLAVDLSAYAINVPERGFWIGVESVGYFADGTYYPIDDRRYGKNSVSDDSKETGVLSPAYTFIKTEPNQSAVTRWNGRWMRERYIPNLVFCFSAIVED